MCGTMYSDNENRYGIRTFMYVLTVATLIHNPKYQFIHVYLFIK